MKKIASMNKREVLNTLTKLANLQNKLVQQLIFKQADGNITGYSDAVHRANSGNTPTPPANTTGVPKSLRLFKDILPGTIMDCKYIHDGITSKELSPERLSKLAVKNPLIKTRYNKIINIINNDLRMRHHIMTGDYYTKYSKFKSNVELTLNTAINNDNFDTTLLVYNFKQWGLDGTLTFLEDTNKIKQLRYEITELLRSAKQTEEVMQQEAADKAYKPLRGL